jgi:uncharacterized damage-inducible protein DinB
MTDRELFVSMAITAWEAQNARINKLLTELSDDQLCAPTAPGRNAGHYLLGHLAAVNDGMLTLFGFGDKLYPELAKIFLANPENSDLTKPSITEVKYYWHEITHRLAKFVHENSVDDWFTKHTAVSDEDFAKEPHRNKLNVLLSRTTHQAYHHGQMIYLAGKNE